MCTHDTRNSSISARWVPCRVVSTAMTRNINKTAVTHNMERQDTHAQGEQPYITSLVHHAQAAVIQPYHPFPLLLLHRKEQAVPCAGQRRAPWSQPTFHP
jgi:hypothetical protein